MLDLDDRPSRGIWNLVGREVADFIKEEIGTTITDKVDAIVGFERGFFRREWPLPAPTLTVDRSGGQTFRDEMQAIRAFHQKPDGQIVTGGRLILGPQLGPEMVTIPAGEFLMGSRKEGYPRPGSTGGPVRCDPSGCRGGTFTYTKSLPAHEVIIAKPFSISKHEIAKREMLVWANYCNASDSILGPAYDEVSALVGTTCPFTSNTSHLSRNVLSAPTNYPVELHPRIIERYLSFLFVSYWRPLPPSNGVGVGVRGSGGNNNVVQLGRRSRPEPSQSIVACLRARVRDVPDMQRTRLRLDGRSRPLGRHLALASSSS